MHPQRREPSSSSRDQRARRQAKRRRQSSRRNRVFRWIFGESARDASPRAVLQPSHLNCASDSKRTVGHFLSYFLQFAQPGEPAEKFRQTSWQRHTRTKSSVDNHQLRHPPRGRTESLRCFAKPACSWESRDRIGQERWMVHPYTPSTPERHLCCERVRRAIRTSLRRGKAISTCMSAQKVAAARASDSVARTCAFVTQ
jgi:hypothetical protein